jgi:hypothetical protein
MSWRIHSRTYCPRSFNFDVVILGSHGNNDREMGINELQLVALPFGILNDQIVDMV